MQAMLVDCRIPHPEQHDDMSEISDLAKAAEAYETPRWAVEEILDREILTQHVVDPCAGKGVLAARAEDHGYKVFSFDKYYPDSLIEQWDFLTDFRAHGYISGATVLMNPPFSLAVKFVERCIDLGARKIVCFQRFAWWESKGRRDFWEKHPPNRVYVCGDRASCWRFDIPKDDQGNRYDPVTGKKLAGTTTAHAWFVWERRHPAGTVLGHIYKDSKLPEIIQ